MNCRNNDSHRARTLYFVWFLLESHYKYELCIAYYRCRWLVRIEYHWRFVLPSIYTYMCTGISYFERFWRWPYFIIHYSLFFTSFSVFASTKISFMFNVQLFQPNILGSPDFLSQRLLSSSYTRTSLTTTWICFFLLFLSIPLTFLSLSFAFRAHVW